MNDDIPAERFNVGGIPGSIVISISEGLANGTIVRGWTPEQERLWHDPQSPPIEAIPCPAPATPGPPA